MPPAPLLHPARFHTGKPFLTGAAVTGAPAGEARPRGRYRRGRSRSIATAADVETVAGPPADATNDPADTISIF